MDDSHDIPGYAVNAARAIRDAFVGNDNAHLVHHLPEAD